MKNIFAAEVNSELINRINQLSSKSLPKWGKMNVGQMLAHCSVTYELIYESNHKKTKGFKKFLLKNFVKGIVVGEKPYKKNTRTAPAFLITSEKEFEKEKDRLVQYMIKTQQLGRDHFEGKESHSFGPLTSKEWNTMFFKHLDHHLSQFGV